MLSNLQQDLRKATEHLNMELAKLQAGRANPAIVEWVLVDAYGSRWPLKNISAVSILDAQTITIQPWDKSLMRDIERGITDANIGLNPTNNGEMIMIKIPPLTEERRRELVRIASRLTEEAKVAVRTIRQEYKKRIDTEKTAKTTSEDILKQYETDLQKAVDSTIVQLDALFHAKESDVMKV